ncbi:retrovirus-related Pol polyprotein from type-1 retrotransposable element R2 [Elysia marginata]|uniref:Retrovirus-related Pol polyprotein from type-1 retrotransposable element R2 n=1 Tax=Elysia marginata TaxID=1093978 RepID=A0AAV4JLT0_9GAST|nr:retrovirus-related Pol polyprotein from type-1 retrotransposable element R2 [Elysia marginata]
MLYRTKSSIDKVLREEQAGFREGISCTDQIFVLRTIIDQSLEWNSSIYVNFIDFEKAFDSVYHGTLWKILQSYGVPQKIINILSNMYAENQCCVRHREQHSEWFTVKSGVWQGCVISPILFLLVFDWVMKKSIARKPRGITWKAFDHLEDEDFADDIALLSHSHKDMQEKTTQIEIYVKTVGLKINR